MKKLIIFSENCYGKNKNVNMVFACLRMVHQNKFDVVEHMFMMLGHLNLPCDRDFGHIEKKIRHIEVYTK